MRLSDYKKGGNQTDTRILYKNGYIGIKINGKWMSEHRYVWEMAYGRIPAGYLIHHKNHDRTDNRLENLEMMEVSVHKAYHKKFGK